MFNVCVCVQLPLDGAAGGCNLCVFVVSRCVRVFRCVALCLYELLSLDDTHYVWVLQATNVFKYPLKISFDG